MKRLTMSLLCAAAAVMHPLNARAALKQSCSSIEWNPQFLESYPTAPAACRGVVNRGGIEIAEFKGTVSQVDHDVVQVKVSDVMGTPISTIVFLTGRDGQVVINRWGKTVATLRSGDRLTFWIREGLFGVSPTLTDHPMLLVRPERAEELIENRGLPDHFLDLK
jgi:hypothetical protein